MSLAEFALPLPPPTNSGYKIGTRYNAARGHYAMMAKTDKLIAWEQEVHLLLQGWEPPAKTPLEVSIVLYLPKNELRRSDVDGRHKYLIDQVIGKRRDQWVDRIDVRKVGVEGIEGFVVVKVREIAEVPA